VAGLILGKPSHAASYGPCACGLTNRCSGRATTSESIAAEWLHGAHIRIPVSHMSVRLLA